MSYEEKRAWIYAAVAAGVPVVYFATVLSRLGTTDVTQIAYVQPLLTAIGVAIVLGAAMLVPFGLTLAGIDHFWIAQAMYLAFVLSALTAAVLKIVAYRRGF